MMRLSRTADPTHLVVVAAAEGEVRVARGGGQIERRGVAHPRKIRQFKKSLRWPTVKRRGKRVADSTETSLSKVASIRMAGPVYTWTQCAEQKHKSERGTVGNATLCWTAAAATHEVVGLQGQLNEELLSAPATDEGEPVLCQHHGDVLVEHVAHELGHAAVVEATVDEEQALEEAESTNGVVTCIGGLDALGASNANTHMRSLCVWRGAHSINTVQLEHMCCVCVCACAATR